MKNTCPQIYQFHELPLSIEFQETLHRLQMLFSPLLEQGENAYLVGGEVRNQLLNRKAPPDFDIAVSASPEVLERTFGDQLIPIRASFPVWNLLSDLGKIEIAQFRKEGGYQGRFPSWILPGDLASDAARRDLTINSMYLSLRDFSLWDPNHGWQDLQNRVLRMIGCPSERFEEDYLRLLRLIRFEVNLEGFHIEPETWSAFLTHRHKAQFLSYERVIEEIKKVQVGKRFQFITKGIYELYRSSLTHILEQIPLSYREEIEEDWAHVPFFGLSLLTQQLNCTAQDWWAFSSLLQSHPNRRERKALHTYEQWVQSPEQWAFHLQNSSENIRFWLRWLSLSSRTDSIKTRLKHLIQMKIPEHTKGDELIRQYSPTFSGYTYTEWITFFQENQLPFPQLKPFMAWLMDRAIGESNVQKQTFALWEEFVKIKNHNNM